MERLHQDRTDRITHPEVNFLDSDLPDGFADCAVSSFGLKTLSPMQQAVFARELARILRPGGTFSLVEAADPKGCALRPLYRLYLERILPVIESAMCEAGIAAEQLDAVAVGKRDIDVLRPRDLGESNLTAERLFHQPGTGDVIRVAMGIEYADEIGVQFVQQRRVALVLLVDRVDQHRFLGIGVNQQISICR